MKPFREVLEYWNEMGLLASVAIAIGYFGSRGLWGRLPLLAAIALSIAAMVFAWFLRGAPAEEWGLGERDPRIDRFMWLSACFLWGIAIFSTLGVII